MFKLKKNKRGVAALPGILTVVLGIVLLFGIIGIALVYMGDTVADVTADQTAGSVSEGIGNESLAAMQDIAEKQDSMSGVSIAGIIIAILLAAFGSFLATRRM